MPIDPRIPQCQHIKHDGIRCGSPALRGRDLCYFHQRQGRRMPPCYVPPLNDRASIQAVLSQLMRAAFAGQIDDDRLRAMVYTIQVALTNLRSSQQLDSNSAARPHAHPPLEPSERPGP